MAIMNRRQWIQLASSSLPLWGATRSLARESTGSWDDENIVEYTIKLFDWLKGNFESRAKELSLHNDTPFVLPYDYLAPTDDSKKLRMLEKFAEARLSNRATEEHIQLSLEEFEKVRASLASAEAKAAKTWVPSNDAITIKNGRVFDSTISAGRLSVVLDNSPSMTPYLEKLRDEITNEFASAYFVEVGGCQMSRDPTSPWFFSAPAQGVNPFTPDRFIPAVPSASDRPYSRYLGWTRDCPGALMAMADLMHSDAIYWFCDFDDSSHDEVIRRVARNLMEKKVKLYVHTLDKRPPELIATLAERSGGEVIRKRI
jgi:hypothetical protein